MNAKAIDLLFLEVDMSESVKKSCGACDIAKLRLNAALEIARPVLAEAGYEVRVNHITVKTEEQARELDFVGSPTFRVADSEVVPQHVPNSEERLWSWGGKEFSDPPVGLFLDLILQSLRKDKTAAANQPTREIPSYLKEFLRMPEATSDSACDSCS
ncbi:DUF2703 domain-containing protein [Pleurocapsales cyanobacterium LEGE 06147]|nr:DUF2703 domain-containing protein [Pleurocapsales cyanobacterium LEGE 06147]